MVTQPGGSFRHDTVSAGGYTLDYAQAGPEDATVTLVSVPGSAGLEMSTAKDELAGTYRVIEINPPGFAGKDDLTGPITFGEVAAVLAEAIEKLVDGDFYLLGTSVGGAIAIEIAAALPGRVKGLVLEGSMVPMREEDHRVPPSEVRPPPSAEGESTEPAYPLPPT
uniref:alpha/beta fold hydrolase n=1 Tax=Nocardia asiatica TaxID=209252 RepID=UPI0005C20E00